MGLTTQEYNQLTKTLETVSDFRKSSTSRYLFIRSAGLEKFAAGINLDDDPHSVVGELVDTLDRHGILVGDKNYTALGKLLDYYLTLDEPSENKQLAAGLIVRHGLVRDPAYIETLRQNYAIVEEMPSVAVGTQAFPSASSGPIRPGPGFEPQVSIELEKVLNSEANFLDLYMLLGAIYSAQAVARVEVPGETAKGTGFLIGPDLFLTNQHVLEDIDQVREAVVRFDYFAESSLLRRPGRPFRLKPDFYCSSPPSELDYALVRVDGEPLKEMKAGPEIDSLTPFDLVRQGKHRGYLVAVGRAIQAGERVNIIQHPEGDPLKVVLTQNHVTAPMTANRVWYLADTDHGSSGAPVFNNRWEVVALHHSEKETRLTYGGAGEKISFTNEGIPMKAILADFEAKDLLQYLVPGS